MKTSLGSGQGGFTLTELLVATTITMIIVGGALTTFNNALVVNDSASQISDSSQNLRAGVNQMMRDLMMAGRIIGPGGIPVPTGAGVTAFSRPGPPGSTLTFTPTLVSDGATDPDLNLPDIVTGYVQGPTIIGSTTDIVTILTVDEFMPTILAPPPAPSVSPNTEGVLSPDGSSLTLSATSLWLVGDTTLDSPPIKPGDLVLFKSPNGMAVQTVTNLDATHVYFTQGSPTDWFHFNQRSTAFAGTILNLKQVLDTTTAYTTPITLFRLLMITYYVDNTTVPGTPRLTRVINHFTPTTLAGVVEDLDITYDLVDLINNPTGVTSLPATIGGVAYTSNQIKKVNLHIGVRSEQIAKPAQDYIRNHVSTSVDVRSLVATDRYVE